MHKSTLTIKPYIADRNGQSQAKPEIWPNALPLPLANVGTLAARVCQVTLVLGPRPGTGGTTERQLDGDSRPEQKKSQTDMHVCIRRSNRVARTGAKDAATTKPRTTLDTHVAYAQWPEAGLPKETTMRNIVFMRRSCRVAGANISKSTKPTCPRETFPPQLSMDRRCTTR